MTAEGGSIGSSSGAGSTDAGVQTETARSERFCHRAAAAAAGEASVRRVILESKSQPIASWFERCSGEGGQCRRRRLGGRGRRGFHGASTATYIEEERGVEVLRIEVCGVFVLAVPVGTRGSAAGGNVAVGCGRVRHGIVVVGWWLGGLGL